MRLTSSVPVLLAALVALPTVAQGPEAAPLMNAVYLGSGRVLTAGVPRQLSLNANIAQMEYQPGGLEIAYFGSQQDGSTVTQYVRLAGARRGETTTLLSETVHVGPDGKAVEQDAHAANMLAGWSADGRFLLVQQARFRGEGKDFHIENSYVCADVGVTPVHLVSVPLPQPSGDEGNEQGRAPDSIYWWSPGRTRLLFAAQGLVTENGKRHAADAWCAVYDPSRGRLEPVTPGPGMVALGWDDDTHLLLRRDEGGQRRYYRRDLAIGQDAEVPKPAKTPVMEAGNALTTTSPTAPYLTLDVQAHKVVDEQKVAVVDSRAIWVRRTQGPKPLSAVSVGLTPGDASPEAVWSPKGTQVAFVSHGDLFVTDLTVRPATVRERYAAGEHLPCPEERQLVSDNAKQIGMAMMMYVQDNDEHFPPADGPLSDKILPYLKSTDVFSLGENHFVFQGPAGKSLASLDNPAATVLGTYDVPCAHIVLYADGHVKESPKPGIGQ